MSSIITRNKIKKNDKKSLTIDNIESKRKAQKLKTKKATAISGTCEKTKKIKYNNNSMNTEQNSNKYEQIQEKQITILEELRNKTEELSKKYKSLCLELENSKYLTVQNIKNCNEKLSEQINEIQNLKLENDNSMSQLKQLKNKLNNHLKKAEIFYNKIDLLNKREKNLNKELKIKNRQIELAKKSYEIAYKDYESSLKAKEEAEYTSIPELQQKLLTFETIIKNLENDIKKLNEIKTQHKFCEKKNNDLKNKLNIITNSYHFELKKNNMYNNEENNFTKSKSTSTINLNDNQYNTDPFKKRILKRNEKSTSHFMANQKLKKYVNEILYNNKSYSRNSNIFTSSSIGSYDTRLFKKNEKMILDKIIPNYYMNVFNKRYESIMVERDEILNLIEDNDNKKKKIIHQYNNKFSYSRLQIKEKQKLSVELNCKINKNLKKIAEIKEKINKLNKESKKNKRLLKEKSKNKERLIEQINEIKNKLKHCEEEEENEDEGEEEENEILKKKPKDYKVEKQVKLNY